jgi:hypothetical protein
MIKKIVPSGGNLVDVEFDAVSSQYEHLVDERNWHSVWEQLRIQSHISEREREIRYTKSNFLILCVVLFEDRMNV